MRSRRQARAPPAASRVSPPLPRAPVCPREPRLYSHVKDFGGLVDSGGEAALALRGQQELLQCFPGALHPANQRAP